MLLLYVPYLSQRCIQALQPTAWRGPAAPRGQTALGDSKHPTATQPSFHLLHYHRIIIEWFLRDTLQDPHDLIRWGTTLNEASPVSSPCCHHLQRYPFSLRIKQCVYKKLHTPLGTAPNMFVCCSVSMNWGKAQVTNLLVALESTISTQPMTEALAHRRFPNKHPGPF